IQNTRNRIDRRSTPLRAAVETGKHDGLLIDDEGQELPIAAHLPERLHSPCMCLRSARGQHVLGKALPREWFRFLGQRLRRRSLLPRNRAGWIRLLVNGIQRFSGEAIEQVQVTLLSSLRHRFHGFALVRHAKQCRRRGKISIPDVVVYSLKVPQRFASTGVERQQRVGIKIIANAIAAIEIHDCRTGRRIYNSVLDVDRHACPIVGRSRSFPCVLRPSLVSWLTRPRNGVKLPAQVAGSHVESPDVSRRRRMRLRIAPTYDDQVFVDCTWCGSHNRLPLKVPAKPFSQIAWTIFPEASERV